MSDKLKDMYLARHSLNIADILNLFFFEYFDSDLFSSEVVITKLNFSECALTDCFAYISQ